MKKSVLAIALAVLMAVSLLTVGAMAEGTTITLNEFVSKVEAGNGTYDGEGVVVLIEPASGCRGNHDDHPAVVDGKTPERIQMYDDTAYAQYQRFSGYADISISNVTFKLVVPQENIKFCGAWNDTQTNISPDKLDAELQILSTGAISFYNCVFDNVAVSPINCATVLTFDKCSFTGLGGYGVKDAKAPVIIVNNCEFANCDGGVYMNGAGTTSMTYTGNRFDNIGGRAAIQISAAGAYGNAKIDISNNTSSGNGAIVRQLNKTVTSSVLDPVTLEEKNSFDPNSPLFLAGTGVVENKYIYVHAVNGSNDNDGTSPETAVKTFKEALSRANSGDEIILLSNVAENNLPYVNETITLDLNGKTLSTDKLVSQGNLTIIDSTAVSAPQVSADYSTVTYNSGKINVSIAVHAAFGGTVTLKSGSIVSSDLGAYVQGDTTGNSIISSTFNIEGGYIEAQEFAATTQGKGATLNISGGVLVAKDNAVVAGNGTVTSEKNLGGTTINISGGTMIGHITTDGYIACGVYHPQQGTLNISGGTIYADGGVGILMRAGVANITGGNIIATGTDAGKVGDSTIIQNCYGIIYDENSDYPGMNASDAVTVSGDANVTADAGSEAIHVIQSETASEDRVVVKGGSYSSSVAEFVDESLNYELNNFGIYTYYTDFETALANALPCAQIKNVKDDPSVTMYSLTVDPANGSQAIRVSVPAGTEYTLPTPTNSGYIFLGWRDNNNVTHKAGDVITVNSDMTFVAVWGNLPDVKPSEPSEPETPVFPFYDVTARDWYYSAVKYVYEKGLMDGVDVGVFAPNDTLTRAMVWTIIARAEGVDTTGGATWYAKAQEWVTAKGISDGENPNAAITRQELVTMLYRLAGEPAVSGTITAPDASSVSTWAQSAMTWAMNIGLVEGDENGAVTPTATATRAQAAALIMRYLEA